MGLLYQFPVEENELDDRVFTNQTKTGENQINLKTYGLPYVFWAYLCAIIVVIVFMYLAIRGPIEHMVSGHDVINRVLGLCVQASIMGIPFCLFCSFFYDKTISKSGNSVQLKKSLFGLPYYSKTYDLSTGDFLSINHFMDSPNVAKIEGKAEMSGFENRGYFELLIVRQNKSNILLDRNSRKHDIKKMFELLERY